VFSLLFRSITKKMIRQYGHEHLRFITFKGLGVCKG
jgi:hypothetical protein